MASTYVHSLAFGVWILENLGLLGGCQNRMDRSARKRAELDLQTNLLDEHEITRVVKIVSAIAEQRGTCGRRSSRSGAG